MPIWPQSTVEIEQRQWNWLNVFLTTTDAQGVATAVTTVTSSQLAYRYRYEGPRSTNTRVLDSVTFSLAEGYPYTAGDLTMRIVDPVGALPPTSGRITIVNGLLTDTVNYSNYNYSTGIITFQEGSTPVNSYPVAATVVTRIDWFNAQNGYYSLLVEPIEVEYLGTFTITVEPQGVSFDMFGQNVEVIPFTGVSSTPIAPAPDMCTLVGHIMDLGGAPVENVSLYARLLGTPLVTHGTGGKDSIVASKTDANGFFSFTVVQGLTVDVVIPSMGYRRTIVVPTTTLINLFEIP